jgi:hypothetical protein
MLAGLNKKELVRRALSMWQMPRAEQGRRFESAADLLALSLTLFQVCTREAQRMGEMGKKEAVKNGEK